MADARRGRWRFGISLSTKVIYSPMNAQVIFLKTILKFSLK
jgi:hypothetical protein